MRSRRSLALLMMAVFSVLMLAACSKAPEELDLTALAIMREDHLEWKEVEGGVELTAYTGRYVHLQVPEKVEGKYVVSLGTALVGNDRVQSLILPNTFERMDSAWFTGCDALLSIYGYNVVTVEGDGLALESLEALQLPSVTQFRSSYVAECPALKILQIPRAREVFGYSEDGTLCIWPEALETVELPAPMYARIQAPAGLAEVEGAIWSLAYEPLVGSDEVDHPEDAFRQIRSNAGQDYCIFFGTDRIRINGMEYRLAG